MIFTALHIDPHPTPLFRSCIQPQPQPQPQPPPHTHTRARLPYPQNTMILAARQPTMATRSANLKHGGDVESTLTRGISMEQITLFERAVRFAEDDNVEELAVLFKGDPLLLLTHRSAPPHPHPRIATHAQHTHTQPRRVRCTPLQLRKIGIYVLIIRTCIMPGTLTAAHCCRWR